MVVTAYRKACFSLAHEVGMGLATLYHIAKPLDSQVPMVPAVGEEKDGGRGWLTSQSLAKISHVTPILTLG